MRALLLILFFTSHAWAGPPGGGSSSPAGAAKFQVAAMAMLLTSSTKQGGQGPQGSTILTHTDIQYNKSWWGAGLMFQYDKHGDSETDTAIGPKLELVYAPFYLELGYLFKVDRGFTDRSIANQTGNGTLFGLGIRFALSGGVFFQASYKMRTLKLTKQDGTPLDEPIEQTDGYPVGGIGYSF